MTAAWRGKGHRSRLSYFPARSTLSCTRRHGTAELPTRRVDARDGQAARQHPPAKAEDRARPAGRVRVPAHPWGTTGLSSWRRSRSLPRGGHASPARMWPPRWRPVSPRSIACWPERVRWWLRTASRAPRSRGRHGSGGARARLHRRAWDLPTRLPGMAWWCSPASACQGSR
jgi:hypothetical protein